MRNKFKVTTLLLAAGVLTVCAGTTFAMADSLSAKDKMFAKNAAQGGMAEVRMGELAASQGFNDKVKQFGAHMVEDHNAANMQFKQIASNKNLSLPTDIDANSKALYAKLSNLHGAAFDKAYLKIMRDDHAKTIKLFKSEAAGGTDPDIKSFASKTLSTIQTHYKMLQNIKDYNTNS